MTRTRTAVLALGLCLAASSARAQQAWLGRYAGDSTLGLISNVTTAVPAWLRTDAYFLYYVSQAKLTVHFDPSEVQVVGFTAGSMGVVDSSRTAGTFSVMTSGCGFSPAQVGSFQLKLLPGASSGSRIYVTTDSTQLFYNCSASFGPPFAFTFNAAPTALCSATELWGDVDGNSAIDSRDALITLSAAVGLPVVGFNLGQGDVDGDGLVNSRDALLMLSYAIGVPTGSTQIGFGIPTACPGNGTPTERIVMRYRSPSSYDSLAIQDSAAAAPALVNFNPGPFTAPRLASDGYRIVYGCQPSNFGACIVTADGVNWRSISNPLVNAISPDWSPSGSSIVYLLNSSLAISDTTGNAVQLPETGINVVAYDRTGTKLAYVQGGQIYTVNADSTGSGNALVPVTGVSDVIAVRWSPNGDSLAFTRGSTPGIWVTSVTGGGPVPVTTFRSIGYVSGQTQGFDWSKSGFVFASEDPGMMGLWLVPNNGPALVRLATGPWIEPSFRRNP